MHELFTLITLRKLSLKTDRAELWIRVECEGEAERGSGGWDERERLREGVEKEKER